MAQTFNELFQNKGDHPSIWRRIIRVLYDAARGFIEDDCYSKASALTFYSLLSVVPVLAVLFGIAKGFGLEDILELEITRRFGDHKEFTDKLVQFAYSWLNSVKGNLIAGVGVFVLFWSVVGLLSSIETTLNQIWKIPFSRAIGRRISDYLAAMVVCPFFFITSSSTTVWLSHLTQLTKNSVFVDVVNPLLLFFLKLSPYFLSWFLFTFIYYFLPNTKVYMRSAVIAGLVGGSAFQMWQWIYIKFQIGASSYGAIYGSFAALPLFLIWLQISWLIFLVGAEIAFETENDLFVPYRKTSSLSSKAVALLITYRCVETFIKGDTPQTDRSLAHELGISFNHLHLVLDALQQENILAAVTYQDRLVGYQPARAIDTITFSAVCKAIEKNSNLTASVLDSTPFLKIQEYLASSDKMLESSPLDQPIASIQ